MEYKDLNDYELVSKVAENEDVTEILFEKYRPLITTVANKLYTTYKPSGIDVSDLIQEGMIGFSMAINTYLEQKDTLFFTYASKCIERKMISSLVSANRQKHKILNNSISMEAIEEGDFLSLDKIVGDNRTNPEDIAIDNENTIELFEYLKEDLTTFESEVFELKKSGFTYKEIAEVLDVEPKKVDNSLQRIKGKIKNYIANKNIDH
ncbi:MAG: sigma-70 family RNA polymerase sigma factor [Bacilli bacterium]|nr:sigma-70 family RNA polymerase sigma factor [Bacilli bacterium]